MKKEMKEQLIRFLTKAQEIITADGETEFSEIKKKNRQEIAKIFGEMFPDYDVDGDSDYSAAYYRLTEKGFEISIELYSHCESFDKILDDPYNMQVELYVNKHCIENLKEVMSYLQSMDVETELPLALLNTSILTTAGEYILTDITPEEAQKLVVDNRGNLDSAIGHAATAEVMTTLLGVEIPVNRQMFAQQVGQQALVFKLNGRLPEGTVLTTVEIEEVGYKFQLLERRS